jgi:hypothetical protein
MTSIDAGVAKLDGDRDWWWGHHAKHGWLVLDRLDVRNAGESRYLVRCRDWSSFEVSRVEFASDKFTWFKKHLGNLPLERAQEACAQLAAYRQEFIARAANFRLTQRERDWASKDNPTQLLRLMSEIAVRKLRLFGIACCRRIWPLLRDDCRHCVLLAERLVEGEATLEEANKLRQQLEAVRVATIQQSAGEQREREVRGWCLGAVCSLLDTATGLQLILPLPDWHLELVDVRRLVANAVVHSPVSSVAAAISVEERAQADLLREIVGNPFRKTEFAQGWRTPTVLDLAHAIYQERAFAEMPILADALDEAGCANAEILQHCREPREHVRGCWLLDLIRELP